MTKTKLLITTAIIAWQTSPIHAALVASCNGITDCSTNCKSTSTTTYYCCPNGNYKKVYSCPTGYTVSGKTCSRTASSHNDDTGYYTQAYGTCDASETQVQCFTKTTNSSTHCMLCSGGII